MRRTGLKVRSRKKEKKKKKKKNKKKKKKKRKKKKKKKKTTIWRRPHRSNQTNRPRGVAPSPSLLFCRVPEKKKGGGKKLPAQRMTCGRQPHATLFGPPPSQANQENYVFGIVYTGSATTGNSSRDQVLLALLAADMFYFALRSSSVFLYFMSNTRNFLSWTMTRSCAMAGSAARACMGLRINLVRNRGQRCAGPPMACPVDLVTWMSGFPTSMAARRSHLRKNGFKAPIIM